MLCVWQGRLSGSTQFITSIRLLSRLAFTLSRPALLTSMTWLCQIYSKKNLPGKKRTDLLSQPKNNTNANYFECDVHPHIVQSYWQHQVPFNQRCHINWQQGFQRFEILPHPCLMGFNHSEFEKDPLLLWKSFNWDVTGEFVVVGTHRDFISSCTLFNSQVSKHAAMFRRTAQARWHILHLTLSPLFFFE